MTFRFLLSLVASLPLLSCSSQGFHREELHAKLGDPPVVNDQEIASAIALKPQLPKPFRIGVYFQGPDANGRSAQADWRWTAEDKQKILSAADRLVAAKEVSQIFELSSSLVGGTDLRSLRLAAAQHGADALLIVGGAKDVDSYANGWGWTYIGLVTTLFVPATKTNVLFLTRAALWDVRNQFLYLSAEAESEQGQTKPYAFSDDRELITKAKESSLAQLKERLEQMAEALAGQRQAAR